MNNYLSHLTSWIYNHNYVFQEMANVDLRFSLQGPQSFILTDFHLLDGLPLLSMCLV